MPYFALLYDTVDNFVERRQPFRGAHLAMVDAAYRDGTLVLGGALKPSGALLVFRTAAAGEVERFATSDPYVRSGLVISWRVQEWSVVNGDGSLRP